jgi:hypothetical protein
MAQTMGNLGSVYADKGEWDRAAHYVANAYLIFAHLGAVPEAQKAAGYLVSILGPAEAANAYLARMVEEHG